MHGFPCKRTKPHWEDKSTIVKGKWVAIGVGAQGEAMLSIIQVQGLV